jgi:hypothetical protein
VRDGSSEDIPVDAVSAYAAEIEDYLAHLREGRKMKRVTSDDGRLAVEMVREELRQIHAHA